MLLCYNEHIQYLPMYSLSRMSANVLAAVDPELVDKISTKMEYPSGLLHDEYILVNIALGYYRDLKDTAQQMDRQRKTFVELCKNIILKRYNTLDISHYNCLPDLKTFEDMFIGVDTSKITCFRVHHNKTFNFDYLSIILKACKNMEIIDIYGCRLISDPMSNNDEDGVVSSRPLLEEIDNIFIPLVALKHFRLQHYNTSDVWIDYMDRINNCLLFKSSQEGSKLQYIAIDWCDHDHNRFNVPYRPTITDYGNIVHLSLRNVTSNRYRLGRNIARIMVNLSNLDLSVTVSQQDVSQDTDCVFLLRNLNKLQTLCVNGCTLFQNTSELSSDELKKLELFACNMEIGSFSPLLNRYLESHKLTIFNYIQTYLTKYWMEYKYLVFGFKLIGREFDRQQGMVDILALNENNGMYMISNMLGEIDRYSVEDSEDEEDEEFRGPNRQYKKMFKLFYGFLKDPRCDACDNKLQKTLSNYITDLASLGYRYSGISELMDSILELAIAKDDIQSSRSKQGRLKKMYIMLNNTFVHIIQTTCSTFSKEDNIMELFARYYLDIHKVSIIKTCRLIAHYAQLYGTSIESLSDMVVFLIKLIMTVDIQTGINKNMGVELISVHNALDNVIREALHVHLPSTIETLISHVNVLMSVCRTRGCTLTHTP